MSSTDWPRYGSLSPDLAIQRREEAAVGRVVFIHDVNTRVYINRGHGPEPRHHYVPREIVGETRVSWLVGWVGRAEKYPKKDPRGLYGLLDIEDALWASTYSYEIGRRVTSLRNASDLRAIAKIIGFDPEAKR